MKKTQLLSWIIIAITIILSIVFYGQVPAQMDTHWDAQGQVNGTMTRFWGMFLMPMMMVGLTLLLYYLPRIDPLNPNFEGFQPYYYGFIAIFNVFMLFVHGYMILWNAKITMFNPINLVIPITGILFYAGGVLMKHAKRNWFAGIRTPWTLSSDTVWNKTHRLGAYLFKGAAILTGISVLVPKYSMWLMLISALAAAFIPVIYSYIVYRQEQTVQ